MASHTSTIASMAAKTETINIRVSASVKRAISDAAKKHPARDIGPWLIWLAAEADKHVMDTLLAERKN